MKLFYFTGACALSPHIVLLEAGLDFSLEKIDKQSKKTEHGADFLQINPKGSVPALQLDDGRVLTEGAAIVQYIADLRPAAGLAPPAGTFERYQLLEILNYLSAEVHKSFSPLFNPALSAEQTENALNTLFKKFDYLVSVLGNKAYLLGDHFGVADAYLFTMLGWSRPLRIDLSRWPALQDYHARILKRPTVQAAMRAEGLLKSAAA